MARSSKADEKEGPMRRLVSLLILLPIAVLLLVFAVANRKPVSLSLDPFEPTDPVLSISGPFFVYLFVALIAGVLIGGVGVWLTQRSYRRDAKRLRRESERLRAEAARAEMDEMRRGRGDAAGPKVTSEPRALTVVGQS